MNLNESYTAKTQFSIAPPEMLKWKKLCTFRVAILQMGTKWLLSATLFMLSGCSSVELVTPLRSLAGLNASAQAGSAGSTPGNTSLASLKILGQIQSDNPSLEGLQLELSLTTPGQTPQKIRLNPRDLQKGEWAHWLNLAPGQFQIEALLRNAEGVILSRSQAELRLLNQNQASLDLRLDFSGQGNLASGNAAGNASIGQPQLSLTPTAPASAPDFRLLPQSDLNANLNTNPNTVANPAASPSKNTPLPANSTNANAGSTPAANPADANALNLRLLESGSDRLSLIWDAPAQSGITGYDIYRNGQLIQANHPQANFQMGGLFDGTDYAIQIVPKTANGPLAAAQHSFRTSSSTSGGGGGGGGGAAPVAPTVNNSPVIQSLVASRTTLTGLKQPIQLTANATDDSTLAASAYQWSCLNCGDASFSSTQGHQVVWTAPTNPGTYTLQVSVSDGVNAAVISSIDVVVQHLLADVIVVGNYQ